ncbi:hypothetical protein [Mesorhizobium sp. M0037]|uniref:hypothetical protein n=1 Tax=unclassified Mesorhizobium TaxID=325217 RepID=UPI00333D0218
MLGRQADFAGLDAELSPDVVVMVEVIGRTGAEIVANHLGRSNYHVAGSDLSVPNTAAHEGLEVAVISKIPMIRVTEYDVKLDGRTHEVFGSFGGLQVAEELLTSSGLSQVQPTGGNDRGTLRVDLANGLTIFPVNLKSNINNACSDATDANRALENMAIDVPAKLTTAIAQGFARQVDADKRNAAERERVIAAVKVVADKATAEGRTTIIAGDFNTSLEQGKAGSAFADCNLQPFECKKAPFPAAACVAGDGFDDTFAILTTPLIGASAFTGAGSHLQGHRFCRRCNRSHGCAGWRSSRFQSADAWLQRRRRPGADRLGGESLSVARVRSLRSRDHLRPINGFGGS